MATNEKSAVSDLKKRAFEALERRFSAAKAELENQQKDKKQCHDEKEQILTKHSSPISSPKLKSSSSAPSSVKGQFASPNHIHLQRSSQGADEEASGPTYFLLSQPVHANLLPTSNELSSKRGSIGDKIVRELLISGDSAQKYMHGSRSMKIDNWLLLDSLVQGQGASKGAFMRATTSYSKCSKSHVSMQQHRKFGSLDLPQEFHDFNLFKPMHEMWKGYILQLVNNGKGQLSHCLLSADLHGAILQVVQCKIPSFTGTCGIMIRETKETFGLITQDNKFQVVPKKGSVFIFQAGCWRITLQGDKLSLRNVGT